MIEEEIVRHAFPSSLESYGNDPKFVPFSYSIVHLWKLTGGGARPCIWARSGKIVIEAPSGMDRPRECDKGPEQPALSQSGRLRETPILRQARGAGI